jgi:hypothetical protein
MGIPEETATGVERSWTETHTGYVDAHSRRYFRRIYVSG